MSVKVNWTTDNGQQSGILTRKSLPNTASQELPLVIRDDGAAMTPNDLTGITLEYQASQAAMYLDLIEEAKRIGYTVVPRK